jgi:hypothetical protein
VAIVGALIAGVGLLFRLWGTEILSPARMLGSRADAERLVEDGPYALVQNPLYLGTLLILAGWSAGYGWITALVFTVLHTARFHRITLHERSMLRSQWGEQFDDYARRVPRWIPSLSRLRQGGAPRFGLASILANAPLVLLTASLWAAAIWGLTWPLFPSLLAGFAVTQVYLVIERWHRSPGRMELHTEATPSPGGRVAP